MAVTPGYAVNQGPSADAGQISAMIAEVSHGGYDSPLLPYAGYIHDLGVAYGVDPALAVAVGYYENHFGMSLLTIGVPNSAWDPYSNSGSYNWFSISDAYYGGWPVSGSRWGQYPDIESGIRAFFELITREYYPNGQATIGSIMWGVGGSATVTGTHAYAPAFENRASYVDDLCVYINRMEGLPPGTTPPTPPPDGLRWPQLDQRTLLLAGVALGVPLLFMMLGDD